MPDGSAPAVESRDGARAVHLNSPRSKHPFVAINCGALLESLLESELLGYERGAFTGAERVTDGLVVQARGGTLFLDELGEMPWLREIDSGQGTSTCRGRHLRPHPT